MASTCRNKVARSVLAKLYPHQAGRGARCKWLGLSEGLTGCRGWIRSGNEGVRCGMYVKHRRLSSQAVNEVGIIGVW